MINLKEELNVSLQMKSIKLLNQSEFCYWLWPGNSETMEGCAHVRTSWHWYNYNKDLLYLFSPFSNYIIY